MENVGTFAYLEEQTDDVREMVARYVRQHPPDKHHGEGIHGRLHTPSPQAVAQLRASLAEGNGRQAQPVPVTKSLAARIVAQARQRKQQEPVEERDEMAKGKHVSEDEVRSIWQEQIQPLTTSAEVNQVIAALGVDVSHFKGKLRRLGLPYAGQRDVRPVRVQTEKGEAASVKETAPVVVDQAVPKVNGRPADAVAVADGADRVISLGRLVRDLQGAGVAVKASGRVVIELEF